MAEQKSVIAGISMAVVFASLLLASPLFAQAAQGGQLIWKACFGLACLWAVGVVIRHVAKSWSDLD
jgi:hypothetical protein